MTEITPNRFTSNMKTYGSSLAMFLLFIAGIVILYKTLHQTNTQDIYAQLRALPASKILLSLLFTLLGYAALVGYDWSALKYVGKKFMRIVQQVVKSAKIKCNEIKWDIDPISEIFSLELCR